MKVVAKSVRSGGADLSVATGTPTSATEVIKVSFGLDAGGDFEVKFMLSRSQTSGSANNFNIFQFEIDTIIQAANVSHFTSVTGTLLIPIMMEHPITLSPGFHVIMVKAYSEVAGGVIGFTNAACQAKLWVKEV
jgi:hypothetical protein